MSKRKGSSENDFRPGIKMLERNLTVATWGRFATARYDQAREIVEGWAVAPAKEVVAKEVPSKARAMQKDLDWYSKITVKYVRNAVLSKDAEALRKLAEVLEQLHVAASPVAAAVLIHVMHTRDNNLYHQFTFLEIRDAVAEFEGLKPPYEEKFEKQLRRLIKKLGIPIL
jgi:hypothetical protein